jgi:dimethylamine/trimethylamine dehydrogenase
MIGKLANVAFYRGSPMTSEDIVELAPEHVVIATGSLWRRDGIGTMGETPADIEPDPAILTPDDVFSGGRVMSPVLIYDDENYFMGGALAEKLRLEGHEVTLATPMAVASSWTQATDEQYFIQRRLLELGVRLVLSHRLTKARTGQAELACVYTERALAIDYGSLILVTGRIAEDSLYHELAGRSPPFSLARIGDCLAPSSIADATFSGHRFARELDASPASREVGRERPV